MEGGTQDCGEIEVGALALLTLSFRTYWLEEAVGEVFARASLQKSDSSSLQVLEVM